MSGCRIRNYAPLEPMEFTIKMNWKDEETRPGPPGEVSYTFLKDLNNERKYKFEKKWRHYELYRGAMKRYFIDDEDWEEMRDAGLLPLGHLSSETLKILEENAARLSYYPIDVVGCARIVEAIINDPPPGYEKYKGSSEWILKFHRRP
ncbi:hypothetical protein FOZ60_003453 [Perkinsus olseni]|uniref:Uncharacterized protein n=1 Tax=Perkinsus olseni TaxID=32597 RepID=A0A7J6NVK3_PEROL|nr:hypothetical protein FOZ60_003453 [Perkinsus olseni]